MATLNASSINYSVDYAFTVTLNRKFNELTTDQQAESMSPWIFNYMLAYGRNLPQFTGRNMIITSVMELTTNANIHIHGVLKFPIEWLIRDVNIWFRDMFRTKRRLVKAFGISREVDKSEYFGFVNIKPCDDLQGWKKYLEKNFCSFVASTGRRPIISDEYSLFDAEQILNYHN